MEYRIAIRAIKSYEEDVKETYPELVKSRVEIYIDSKNPRNQKKIDKLLKSEKKRYETNLWFILSNKTSRKNYCKCQGFSNIYEMILTKKRGENYRIYCKEFNENGRKVVMLLAYSKKNNAIKDDPSLQSKLKEADRKYYYKYQSRYEKE